MTRSVLLVPVREVASVVEPWTERTCESKPSHGIPAQGDAATLAAAEADLSPRLPLRGRAGEVAFLTEVEPERWLVDASFPLEFA